MDVNKILSELVIIADSLEKRGVKEISADIDAAIFTIAQETALPRNKSLASVVKEHKAIMEGKSEEEVEEVAVQAASEIKELLDKVMAEDSITVAATLKSISQSINSLLDPNVALSPEIVAVSSELLTDAEKKLHLDTDLHGIGYRVEVIRGKLKNG